MASPAGGGKLFLFGTSHCIKVETFASIISSGGEFSSLHQTTFHHYRDFWCFDITTHTWDRIETKILPSARSGHRYVSTIYYVLLLAHSMVSMAMWKHYIVLFGGFYDPGVRSEYLRLCRPWKTHSLFMVANYLNDLWLFDTQEYKWKQVEFRENDRRPS